MFPVCANAAAWGAALVTEIYSVAPLTAGSGLNITVWSCVDQLNISVLTDGSTAGPAWKYRGNRSRTLIEIRRARGSLIVTRSPRWRRHDTKHGRV